MKKRLLCMLIAAVSAVASVPVLSASAADYNFFKQYDDGSFVEGWNQHEQGSYEITENADNGFSASWDGIYNCYSMYGTQFDPPKEGWVFGKADLTYNAEIEATGIQWYGVYGRAPRSRTEFYVVEGWGSWRPPGGQGKMTVEPVEINGVQYDLYKSARRAFSDYNTMITQYWSVRTENPFREGEKNTCSGMISVAEHLRAWNEAGANLDETLISDISFYTEAYGGMSQDISITGSCKASEITFEIEENPNKPAKNVSMENYLRTDADGTYQEVWRKAARTYMDYQDHPDGSLTGTWNGFSSAFFRNGIRFPEGTAPAVQSEPITVSYEVEIEAEGKCSYGLAGYTKDTGKKDAYPVYFQIIEGWNSEEKFNKTVEIDGVLYDLYHASRLPAKDQLHSGVYWMVSSVRRDNTFRTGEKAVYQGTVSLDQHIRAWESIGFSVPPEELDSIQISVDVIEPVSAAGTEKHEILYGSFRIRKPEIVFGDEPAENVPVFCIGDANCSGQVDVSDAVLIVRFAAEDRDAALTDQGRQNADVTHDGNVDAQDSAKILQYIAKKISFEDLANESHRTTAAGVHVS